MRRSGISFILALAGLICSSCAVESDMDIGNIPHVNGRITDLDDNPLEHIKVTFEWSAGTEPSVVYTSSEGMFSTSFIECWDTGGGHDRDRNYRGHRRRGKRRTFQEAVRQADDLQGRFFGRTRQN
ncbi:MAG: hypothetical protein IJX11_09435 [Bacteroidales bacterium]|nr:hypothetical protein [Bacteroidales bacterium]